MPTPLDHPESCGCQVCRDYRERLATDPRARELDASGEDVDRYQPDSEEWHDPEPVQQEAAGETVVVEYRTVEHVEHRDRGAAAKADTKDLERRTRRLERKVRRRRGGKAGLLRTVAIGVVLVWFVSSLYPKQDSMSPFPGVACTDPGTVQPVTGFPSTPPDWSPYQLEPEDGWGSPIPEVPSVRELARDAVVGVVGAGLNAAGDVVRKLADSPPNVESIRAGLLSDVETVGKVAGFVVGAVSGKSVDELLPEDDATSVAGGCVPCPTLGGGDGVEVAARAALAAGWTGADAVTAVAIAGAESGYDPRAANPSSTARGMWQTMMSYHADKYQGASWTDPYANARVAHEVYQSQGWSAWTVYTSGAYRSHLDEARAAVIAAHGSDTTPVAASVPMKGLRPPAQKAADYVRATWGVDDIGGYATSGHVTNSAHYRGLAIDVMTYGDKATGQTIADYFAGPGYQAFGVDNVIFNRRIYNEGRGWHDYPDRGNPTLNHEDHVHVDFHAEGGTGAVPAATCIAPVSSAAADGWRVGTFNILGAGHTPNTWRQRWSGVPKLLASTGVSVAALQEVHPEQRPGVDGLPGWQSFGDWDAVTTWRTDMWRLEDSRYVRVPMYPGRYRNAPLVQLRHRDGHAVWFLNVHNSRNGWANRAAVRRELDVASRLAGPVVWLGDTNTRTFAARVSREGFHSAGTPGIDQIVGTGVTFRNGSRVATPLVRATSDHALVVADLTVSDVL